MQWTVEFERNIVTHSLTRQTLWIELYRMLIMNLCIWTLSFLLMMWSYSTSDGSRTSRISNRKAFRKRPSNRSDIEAYNQIPPCMWNFSMFLSFSLKTLSMFMNWRNNFKWHTRNTLIDWNVKLVILGCVLDYEVSRCHSGMHYRRTFYLSSSIFLTLYLYTSNAVALINGHWPIWSILMWLLNSHK